MILVTDIVLTLNIQSFKYMNFWSIEVYAQEPFTYPLLKSVFALKAMELAVLKQLLLGRYE